MVAANHQGRIKFAIPDHFIKGKSKAMALAKAHPADAGWQTLKGYALTRHIKPIVQMFIVGDQFFHALISFINIFRVARKSRPAEWANSPAEERANISWNKSRKIKGVFKPHLQSHLPDVVAVIQGWNAERLHIQHGLNMDFHRGH